MNKYAQVYFNTYFAKLAKMAPPPSPPPPLFKPEPSHINRPTGAPSPIFPPRVINKEPLEMLPRIPEEHPVLSPDPTPTGLNKEQLAEQIERYNRPSSTFLANLSPPPVSSVSSAPSSSKTLPPVKEKESAPASSAAAAVSNRNLPYGVDPKTKTQSAQETKADLIKNWSTYHGKRNLFNPNSFADKAMLDAMVDAKINGKSVVAVANGKLSTEDRRASGNLISYKNDPNSIYSRTLKQ